MLVTNPTSKIKPVDHHVFYDVEGRRRIHSPNTGIRHATALDTALYRSTGPLIRLTGFRDE